MSDWTSVYIRDQRPLFAPVCLPSPSPIMSLKDLTDYISDQEEAISKLSHGVDSETIACAEWREFRDSLWGRGLETLQGEEKVERDRSIPMEDVVLPEKHIIATLPYVLAPDTPKILVRSEYDEAERETVLASEHRSVFVVCGQRGVGLSHFLPTTHRI